jgi:hypothetical protein
MMPELKAADKAPIINLSSIAHNSTRALDLNDINYQTTTLSGLEKLLTLEVLQYPFHQRTGISP